MYDDYIKCNNCRIEFIPAYYWHRVQYVKDENGNLIRIVGRTAKWQCPSCRTFVRILDFGEKTWKK